MNQTIRIASALISVLLCFFLQVRAEQNEVGLPSRILVFQDTYLSLSAEKVIAMPVDSGHYYDADKLSFDFFNSAIWCRFSLKNDSDVPVERFLWINNADFYSIELHTLIDAKPIDLLLDGKSVHSEQKQMIHNTPLMRLVIPAHAQLQCLLRVHKLGGAVVLPLKLLTAQDLVVQEDTESDINLFYYGMQMFVVIFNLVLLILMRRWLYFTYAFYVLFSMLSICGISGYTSGLIYPDLTWLSVRDTVFFNFPGTIFLLLFVQDFLHIRNTRPHINTIFKVMIGALLVGSVLTFFSPIFVGVASLYSNITTLLTILLVIGTAIASLKTNRVSAVFILVSYVPLLASVAAFFLRTMGLLTHSNAMLGLDFALTFQTLVLAVAIVYGLNRDEAKKRKIINESNEMLSKLTLAARETDNAIAIFSRYGDLEWCNKGYENIMQLSAGELTKLLGPHITDISLNADIGEYYRQAAETGKSVVFETEFIGANGRKRWLQTTLTPVSDNRGGICNYITVDTDLTNIKRNEEEKDRLQEQLLRSQKMETVGQLAGGIAHDFNNILTPIIGYSDMILADLPEDSNIREDITTIFNAAQRAKKLVSQILTFSRHFKEEAHPLAVTEAIDEVFNLLSSSLPKNIDMSFENVAKNDHVFADPTQVQQVLMNLCTNAYQAIIPGYGRLVLRIENIEIDAQTTDLRLKQLSAGEYLHISVADTGQGMDAYTLEHLCDPFFTTKEVGKGTGLGLSVVHGIVLKYQGELFFESALGKGTVAHVFLPTCSDAMLQNYTLKHTDNTGLKGKHQSILVVDDEPNIVNMLGRVLQKNGFSPQCFTDSNSALNEYALAPDKFDLIIADQTMPLKSGAELSVDVLKINPDAKIIILTGYSETLNTEIAQSIGIKALLYKPINVQTLLNKVSDVLNGTESADDENR